MLNTWQDVLDKAFRTDVYEPSLYIGDDGLVYGEAAEGTVILGRWGGGAAGQAAAPGSPQSILPGLFGSVNVPLPNIQWPRINWWIVAAIAVGTIIIIRRI